MSNPSQNTIQSTPYVEKIPKNHPVNKALEYYSGISKKPFQENIEQSSHNKSGQPDLIIKNDVTTPLCCCGLPSIAECDRKKMPSDYYEAYWSNEPSSSSVEGFTKKHWFRLNDLHDRQRRQFSRKLQAQGLLASNYFSICIRSKPPQYQIKDNGKTIHILTHGYNALSPCPPISIELDKAIDQGKNLTITIRETADFNFPTKRLTAQQFELFKKITEERDKIGKLCYTLVEGTNHTKRMEALYEFSNITLPEEKAFYQTVGPAEIEYDIEVCLHGNEQAQIRLKKDAISIHANDKKYTGKLNGSQSLSLSDEVIAKNPKLEARVKSVRVNDINFNLSIENKQTQTEQDPYLTCSIT